MRKDFNKPATKLQLTLLKKIIMPQVTTHKSFCFNNNYNLSWGNCRVTNQDTKQSTQNPYTSCIYPKNHQSTLVIMTTMKDLFELVATRGLVVNDIGLWACALSLEELGFWKLGCYQNLESFTTKDIPHSLEVDDLHDYSMTRSRQLLRSQRL